MIKYLLVVMIMMLFTVTILICSVNKRKEAAFLLGDDVKLVRRQGAISLVKTTSRAPSDYQLEKAFMFADESLNQYMTKLPIAKAKEMVRVFQSRAAIPTHYANEHAYLTMLAQSPNSAKIDALLAQLVEYFELGRDLIAEENLENAASEIKRIDDYLSKLTPKVTQLREDLDQFFSFNHNDGGFRFRIRSIAIPMSAARNLYKNNPNNTNITVNQLVYEYLNVFHEEHARRQSLIYKMHLKHGMNPSHQLKLG